MSLFTKLRLKTAITIFGVLFSACTATPHPYSLQTPVAQSGPQNVLLGQGIDINSADAAAFEALPGVGSALAQRIVDYRATNGRFRSIQDLQNVPGIGEKTLQRLAPLVRTLSKD